MTIRLATAEDVAAVMGIVREVVSDMAAEGNFQWSDTYPNDARFLTDIASDALFVADVDGKVMGFVTIDQEPAEEYAPLSWSRDSEAIVIHRLAVSRDSRNLGIASRFEEFACQLARERGLDQIRLDTYSTNIGMQSWLGKKGYRKVGDMNFHGKPLPFYCYEKLLSE